MKAFLKDNRLFFFLFAIVFTGLGVALLFTEKATLHLWLNSCHTGFGDCFFRYYSYIAEYGIYIIAFVLMFWKLGASLYMLTSEITGGIIVRILKLIFKAPRPKVFFDLTSNPDALPIVEGVRLHNSNSFPSGHASTFFVLFFTLTIILNYYGNHKVTHKKLIQLLCFLLALTGAYSRIYLSQHFASDVFAGGSIGVLVVTMLFPAFVWLNDKYPKLCNWHINLHKRSKNEELTS